MRFHVKAALLSAFVLPGLGQLYKRDKVKGGVLIVLVNVFLLAALFVVMRGMGQLLLTARFSGVADTVQILDDLKHNSPAARWLLTVFSALWAYGVIDALLARDHEHGKNR